MRTLRLPISEGAPFGARLRAARIALGLTLEQLAGSAGLSKGFLSRVERDEASPSVATLVTLCEVMNIDVGSLFSTPDVMLVRRNEARAINLGGRGVQEAVLTPRSESSVQLIHSDIDPGGHGGHDLYTINCEVEVAYVLRGSIELRFAQSTTVLEAGDALTFPGSEPHTWANTSDVEPAEVIWVVSPAPWSGSR